MNDRCDIRPRLHDLEMQKSLVHRLDPALEPIALEIDRDDVVHVGVDERTAFGMNVAQDQHAIGSRDARARHDPWSAARFRRRSGSGAPWPGGDAARGSPSPAHSRCRRDAYALSSFFSFYLVSRAGATYKPSLRMSSTIHLVLFRRRIHETAWYRDNELRAADCAFGRRIPDLRRCVPSASLTRLTTAAGVPCGANTPCQEEMTRSTPFSAMVGRSGIVGCTPARQRCRARGSSSTPSSASSEPRYRNRHRCGRQRVQPCARRRRGTARR